MISGKFFHDVFRGERLSLVEGKRKDQDVFQFTQVAGKVILPQNFDDLRVVRADGGLVIAAMYV